MFNRLYTAVLVVILLSTSFASKAQYVFEQFNINPNSASRPSYVTVIDTLLYFSADDGVHAREPWVCDGTQAGTKMIKDIAPGGATTTAALLGAANGKLCFVAGNQLNGYEPWITDGTANGTQLLKDVFTGPPHSINTNKPSSATIGNKLYFMADDGPHGKELWVTDGTTNGTMLVKDINPGTGHSVPAQFIEYNNKVYFIADDGTHGSELWITDGTTNGTQLVKDLGTGSPHGYINHLIVYNNKLYFTAYAAVNNKSIWGLIESDGTTNGTVFIKEIVVSNAESKFVIFNNKMFFGGNDTSSAGKELWVSDGTANGTYRVKDINPYFGQSSEPRQLTVVGNQLFFIANDGLHGDEIWVTDGTNNGTKLVKDILTSPKNTSPNSLMGYRGKLFFGALDSNGRNGLWTSDGTSNGTQMLKGYDNSAKFRFIGNHTVCNGALYFSGYDTSGHELWKLTDTTTTTPPPTNIIATEITLGNIQITPNPAHSKINIMLDKAYTQASVSITDLTGKVILRQTIEDTKKSIDISIPDIPSGVYIVNLQHSDGVISERLLIE